MKGLDDNGDEDYELYHVYVWSLLMCKNVQCSTEGQYKPLFCYNFYEEKGSGIEIVYLSEFIQNFKYIMSKIEDSVIEITGKNGNRVTITDEDYTRLGTEIGSYALEEYEDRSPSKLFEDGGSSIEEYASAYLINGEDDGEELPILWDERYNMTAKELQHLIRMLELGL